MQSSTDVELSSAEVVSRMWLALRLNPHRYLYLIDEVRTREVQARWTMSIRGSQALGSSA